MAGRSEKAEQNDALVELSALPRSLFYRNNTGQAWQGLRLRLAPGAKITIEPGMVVLRAARPISFGLPGSGDIMGACDGVPVAGEMKSDTGSQETTQSNFEVAWKKAGGIYVLARSAREMVDRVSAAIAQRAT